MKIINKITKKNKIWKFKNFQKIYNINKIVLKKASNSKIKKIFHNKHNKMYYSK